MASAAKFLLLFFLSILVFSSSGIFLSQAKAFVQKEVETEHIFHSLHRGLHYKAILHDFVDSPLTFPTTPVTNPVTNPVTVNVPPDNAAPAIVIVPPANPIIVTPTPDTTNPVPFPNTNPANGQVPLTNPVTTPSINPGSQPVSNPVTTYPTPTGGVPVTNPVGPPTTTSTPAVPGQSWCVVKSGVQETALQAALDYACEIGGADCSAIQQGASCYTPPTLQNHASYAFNSYYQKNPMQTSCDFGDTALITNVNPSSGSCVFPTSASSTSSPMTASPITATPTPTTASSSGAAPGSSNPAVVNTSNPALGGGTSTGFGESPPSNTTSTSMSSSLRPYISCIIAVTSIIAGIFVLDT